MDLGDERRNKRAIRLKLRSSVVQSEPLGEIRFVLTLRKGQRTREVVQQVWAQTLELPDGKGCFVQASCIVAKEMEPATGDKPVERRLLTNLRGVAWSRPRR